MERLDKIYVNSDWISFFPNATVTHLPKTHSDHNPLLLEIIPKPNIALQKPFSLETFLCRHLDFNNLVNKYWKGSNYQ